LPPISFPGCPARRRSGDTNAAVPAEPQIALEVAGPTGSPQAWLWQRWLLGSGPADAVFTLTPERYAVVGSGAGTTWFDYDGEGTTLRFGDGVFGITPPAGTVFTVTYLAGGGEVGNVAADTIVMVDPGQPQAASVASATNPFAALGGADEETTQQVRDRAPQAFRAPLRVVRQSDYVEAAESLPWVKEAGTTFCWTGSWLTVFTTADPSRRADLSLVELEQLSDLLDRRRLAGYESYVLPPRYASIDLEITVCAQPTAFPADVEAAVLARLRPGQLPDGSPGFFDHARWSFGQPLESSALLAAVQRAAGRTRRERGRLQGAGLAGRPNRASRDGRRRPRPHPAPRRRPESPRGRLVARDRGRRQVSPVAACGCESEQDPQVVWNPPGLSNIAYRVDRFSGFRRALLEALPDETALLGWRPPAGDLGLQTLEWWAYLADILTFYNERIANESYLRCAQLPASVTGLVALLGYEPRPAIAAVGQVAAIRQTSRPHEPLVIPAGMQFSSTATPGVPVETFEAAAASFSGLSDVPIGLLPSTGAGSLLGSAPSGTGSIGSVLIAGHIGSLKPGDELLLASRVWSATSHDWAKVSVVSTTPEPDPNGGTNTRVALAAAQPAEVEEWLEEAAAADFRLLRPTQAAALWTQTATDQPLVETGATLVILLSAVVRGIAPGDLIFLDGSQGTAVGQVTDAAEKFGLIPYSGATPPNIQVARSVLTTLTPDAYGVVGAEPATVTVRFGLKDVGTLAPTPPTTLAALPATVSAPEGFTVAPAGASAFVEDATGVGIPVTATANADQTLTLAATAATPASFSLAAPLHLLVDLVDAFAGSDGRRRDAGQRRRDRSGPVLPAQELSADLPRRRQRVREHAARRGRRDLLVGGGHLLRPAAGRTDLGRQRAPRWD